MAQKKADEIERFKFVKINILLFINAIVAIIIGFIIMNSTTTLGTILLILGYVILISLSLPLKIGSPLNTPNILSLKR